MAATLFSAALATARKLPGLTDGDRLLAASLRARAVRAEPVVWDEPRDWSMFHAVVIRSCWDYHLKLDQFLSWLQQLEAAAVVVINNPALLRWNSHKRYLLDLAGRGIRIPSTRVVPAKTPQSIGSLMAAEGWHAAVIKPAVSASGHRTRRVESAPTPEDEAAMAAMLGDGDVVAQEFVAEVRTCGEWSLVFCDGRYSHALLKNPAAGEFRVQTEWGGTATVARPPDAVLRHAADLLAALGRVPEYARVDGVETPGGFTLMELELIEPDLFLDRDPEAPDRLADAIVRRMVAQDSPRL